MEASNLTDTRFRKNGMFTMLAECCVAHECFSGIKIDPSK